MKKIAIILLLVTLLMVSGCLYPKNKTTSYKLSTNSNFIKCGNLIFPPNYCDVYGGNVFNKKKYCAVKKKKHLQLKKWNINEFLCDEITVTIEKE